MTDSFAQRFNFDVRNKEVSAFATLYATDVGHVAYEYKEKKQGYFTWLLVEGMKGGAANEKGEVTLGGLVKYLQEQVPKWVRLDMGQEKSQKPYATVGGYKADELVISITSRVQPATPAVSAFNPAAIELEFWNSIKRSTETDDFKEYLMKYPKGTFAGLAKNKIRTLEAATKSEEARPKTGSKPDATEIKHISASEAWVNTGIRVEPGDTIFISASGSIVWDPSQPRVGPEGTEWVTNDSIKWRSYFPIPDAKCASLVMRIGDSKYAVSTGGTFVARNNGILELMVNDVIEGLNDNSGAFIVRILIKH